jgi:selenocysteine lyase/cysteine desulfurase
MVAVPLPPVDPVRLGMALRERHRIEIPITTQGGRSWLRASLQAYNSVEDIEMLIGALHAEL